jgi:putative DNA primase/helicase
LPFLITNHLPKVPADDPALWARPLAIPFDHSLLGREDRGLEDRLCAELPAVLAWAVAGWDDHRQRGRLDPPAAVSDATSTYRINNDSVAEFIDDCCLLNPRRRAKTGCSRTSVARGPQSGPPKGVRHHATTR